MKEVQFFELLLTDGRIFLMELNRVKSKLICLYSDPIKDVTQVTLKGEKTEDFYILETKENYFDVIKKMFPTFGNVTETVTETL